ncbi:cytochrome c [Solibacillus sp. FSL W7-1472]|uniref:c-type cytochrome n=1 Tax=Solibacillus sp. FSL W7-1472 TaxID=2921707 RepID=UPI0030DD29E0
MKYWLLMGVVVAGLAACGDAEDADTTDSVDSTPTESTESSGEKDAAENSDVSAGEKVANASCVGCHGGDLTGSMGPDLTNTSLSKEEIVNVLVNGKGAMPKGTADGEEEAVAEYILSLQ